jgi:hypothetical protein
LAVAAVVALATAYFAVRVAAAWTTTLPQAARDDLRAVPDAALVAVNSSASNAPRCGPAPGALPADARSAVARGFTVDAMTTSSSLSLSGLPGQTSDSFIKAYCAPSVRHHSVLDSGRWPGPATPGAPVEVAAPSSTLAALKLHVGSQLTLTAPSTHARVSLLIVGAFHRLQNPAGYWEWDEVGTTGVQFVGPYMIYDPFLTDPSAFDSGALHADSSTLLVLPPAADGSPGDLADLSAQASSITTALNKDTEPYYSVSGALTADLSALGSSVATAQAQLLAASLLLGAVAIAGLLAASGLLVSIGAGQNALSRARGARRGHLLAAQWAESVVLCVAAAAAPIAVAVFHVAALDSTAPNTAASNTAASNTATAAEWTAAGAVAVLAVAALYIRTLRSATPGEVAVASGRQATVAYGLRLGADVALAALAALALWQSSSAPLAGRGPSGLVGTDLVVAAAPALAVAAGAALAGRLLPLAARLAERAASRARRLFTLFAFWQVGRTTLGYVLPALVSVAAVAGATFAAAHDASWRRSTQDQAAYDNGGQVVVTAPWGRSDSQGAAIAHARGVLAATPVVRMSQSQNASLIALDAATAPSTVLLRPDLASMPVAALWRAVTPQQPPGLAIPGRPTSIAVSAQLGVSRLSAAAGTPPAHLDPATAAVTVQDAAGLVYRIGLGQLPADGQPHALTGSLASLGSIDYPLRLLRFDLSYLAPPQFEVAAALTVHSIASLPGSALSNWVPSTTWGATMPCFSNSPTSAAQTGERKPAPDGGWTMDFSSGYGQNFDVNTTCTSIQATVALNAGPGTEAVPVLATTTYLQSTGTAVGATVSVTVNGSTIPAHIVASVASFPTLPGAGPGGLIVDLPSLAAAAVEQGDTLWPPTEWWLRTADGAAPPGLPAGDTAVTVTSLADSLAGDPLSDIAPRIMNLGAVDLVLLAGLALGASLAATGRRQSGHEQILDALGAGHGQRTAIRLVRNALIVIPAALLGWGLGLLVARQLVPDFVVTPTGAAPLPSVLFTTRPAWSALAVAVMLVIAVAAALDLRRKEVA